MEKLVITKYVDSIALTIFHVDIDLINLITKLDTTASDIVTYQRDSLVERKELAQKTKDFKKLDDASKLNEFKGLLKGTSKITARVISDNS